MRPLDIFKEFFNEGWTSGLLDTQWKVVDGTLYFQHSVSKLDWILNFIFAPMRVKLPYKNMAEEYKVHSGFFLAYKVNAEEIQKLDFKRVAGYSRGGPLAMFAHEDREFRTGKSLETGYVFGCPRAICKTSAEVQDRWKNIIRFENPRDIVTRIPFSCMGFSHVGIRIRLGGEAKIPKDEKILSWMSGHSPEEYIQRLGAYNV